MTGKAITGTTLVLGGARSGKSSYAESLFEPARDDSYLYLATGQALDGEMAARIGLHRARRGAQWRTIEEPRAIAPIVTGPGEGVSAILVDCLTLWISNLMEAGLDVAAATEELCTGLIRARVPVVLVSNEVGMGLVPETPLGRAFRDAQGRVNQRVAAACNRVVFVAAGLPLILKG
jgi:adenosylcobinamide kinase/adenosylcobinamide-phosphate guanylyltransferase